MEKIKVTSPIFVTILISVFMLISALSIGFVVSNSDTGDTEYILVKNRGISKDVLSSQGYDITEDYGGFFLIKANTERVKILETQGFIIERMDNRDYVDLNSYSFNTRDGVPDIPSDLHIGGYPYGVRGYYIVQFVGPIKPQWKSEMEKMGASFHEYRQRYNFIVEMDRGTMRTVEDLDFVNWVGIYQPAYKINIEDYSEEDVTLNVYIFSSADPNIVAGKISSLGGKITEIREDLVSTQISGAAIKTIANFHNVKTINKGGVVNRIYNEDATWITQTAVSNDRSVTDHGIVGDGELLTVMDSELRDTHEMFEDPEGDPVGNNHRKIQDMVAYCTDGLSDGDFHGTHVTGTVLGDASTYLTYNNYDGHSIGARVIFQDIDNDGNDNGGVYPPDDLKPPMQDSYDAGSRMQTNSWGGGSGYTDAALEIDTFTWNHKDYNVLFAMGNSGNGANTISQQPEAKNAISVGGVTNNPDHNTMYSSSSRGYATDGRIKPTILGVAEGVTSSSNSGDTAYTDLTGTSMATPGIAGQVGQIRQYYNEGWYPTGTENSVDGFNPSAALCKATLVNGAVEITGTGAYDNDNRYPNGDQGWGRSKLEDVLYFNGDARVLKIYDSWNEGNELSTGNTYSDTFEVVDASIPVEVTLVWTDYVGGDGASPALVNDLDLEVWKPSGTRYVGNAYMGYNPGFSQDNPTSNPWNGGRTGEWDGLNVVENVLLLPSENGVETGVYDLTVTANQVSQGTQPFALVITGGLGVSSVVPPSITITSPNGGESWEQGTTQTITWTTTSGDGTITGVDLEYSTDNGASWTTIVAGTSDDGSHDWLVPFEPSNQCLIRGTVYDDTPSSGSDTSDGTFTIDYNTHPLGTLSSSTGGGWNLISFNLEANGDNYAQANDLVEILEDGEYGISGNYDKVFYYDANNGRWYSHVPGRASQYNSISTWDRTRGLWIHMTSDDSLTVEGTLQATTDITLYPGWNLVSYPSGSTGYNNLPIEVTKVGYYDSAAQYNMAYDTNPHGGSGFQFNPGEGYWVYNGADTSVTWTVTY
ncbi:MAG: S8 family serine peptidase [Thermoplasmata archaeon]